MKKALITGGAGFLGSHLCDLLTSRGIEVVVLDNFSTGLMQNLSTSNSTGFLSVINGDCRDPLIVEKAIQNCDTVFHLAAQVGVDRVIASPLDTIEINTASTKIVAEACLRKNCLLIFSSTSEVYGRNERVPFREDDDLAVGSPLINRWSYAVSKILDEHYICAMVREKGLRAVVLRLFNAVGPRQRPDFGMVLPKFITAAREDRDLIVYSDGSQKRCFTWCGDTVEALCAVVRYPSAIGNVYNVGSSEEISIAELAEKIISRFKGGHIRFVPEEKRGPGFADMQRRVPDTSRIQSLCGWHPTLNMNQILDRM